VADWSGNGGNCRKTSGSSRDPTEDFSDYFLELRQHPRGGLENYVTRAIWIVESFPTGETPGLSTDCEHESFLHAR